MKQKFKKVTCKNCNKTFLVPEHQMFCDTCGEQLIDTGERVVKKVKNEKDKYQTKSKKTLKRIIISFSLILVIGACAFGGWKIYGGIQNKNYYSQFTFVELDNGTLEVSASTQNLTGNIVIPSSYNGKSVTKISENAFADKDSITKIEIPSNILVVGEKAFYSCDNLSSVVFEQSEGKNVQIKKSAFAECSALKEITLSNSIVSLEDECFSDCSSLETIAMPTSITEMGNYLFKNCSSLLNLSIPNQVNSIGTNLFQNCSKLASVSFLNNPETLSENMFEGCSSLSTLVIPDSVSIVSEEAFKNCSSLNTVTFGQNVAQVCANAFEGCNNLTMVNYPKNLDSWSCISFENEKSNPLYYATNFYLEGKRPEGVLTIAEGVTKISSNAFKGCSLVTKVVIPQSVVEIEKDAFSGCAGVQELEILSSSVNVNTEAFEDCVNLEKATVPAQVISSLPKNSLEEVIINGGEEIGDNAFKNSDKIESVTIASSVRRIGVNLFENCPILSKVNYEGDLTQWASIVYADETANPLYYNVELKMINASSIPQSLNINEDFTNVNAYAFYGCLHISQISILTENVEIDEKAFYNCSGIKKASLSAKYLNCLPQETVMEVTLLGGETLNNNAFVNAVNLEKLVLPNSITNIGENLFAETANINRIDYKGTLSDWCKIDFAAASANPFTYTSNVYINDELLQSKLILPQEISSLKQYTFANLDVVTEVVLHNTITDISDDVFYECNNIIKIESPVDAIKIFNKNVLQTIIINNSEDLPANIFDSFSELKEIVLGDGITTIGEEAFKNCSKLIDITIPSSVVNIKTDAFKNCGALQNIYFGGEIENWCGIVFGSNYSNPMYHTNKLYIDEQLLSGVITLAEGTKIIPAYLFRNNTNITSCITPNTLEEIGQSAFQGCSSLLNISLAKGVKSIDITAFEGCSSLNQINVDDENPYFSDEGNCLIDVADKSIILGIKSSQIPSNENVLSIKSKAFKNVDINSLIIPKNIASIGSDAFSGCDSLLTVNYLGTIDEWCKVVFENKYSNPLVYADKLLLNGAEISGEISLSTDTTEIPAYTFKNASITKINFPDTMEFIGEKAFYNCFGLTEIVMPNEITTIEDGIFYGCKNIISISGSSDMFDYGAVISSGNIGHLFGKEEYEGSVGVVQDCYESMNSFVYTARYYLPQSLTTVIVTKGGLWPGALENCNMLTCIKLLDENAYNTASAIDGCDSLKILHAPSDMLAYIELSNLEELYLTSGTKLEDKYLSKCTNLKKLGIGSTISTIDLDAFNDELRQLEEIIVSSTNTKYSSENGILYGNSDSSLLAVPMKVSGEISVKSGTKIIGEHAFWNRVDITKITIPKSVMQIKEYAFASCDGLEEVVLDNGLQSSGAYAFSGCYKLEKVNYLGTIAEWCNIAFADAKANPINEKGLLYLNGEILSEINIPSGVEEVKDYCFYNIQSVSLVTMADTVKVIGKGAFSAYLTSGISTINFSNSLEIIEDSAFNNCDGLSVINLPITLVEIGALAFNDCDNLEGVSFGSSLRKIGEDAFNTSYKIKRVDFTGTIADWCKIEFCSSNTWPSYQLYINGEKLTELNIPAEVTELKANAFRGITSINGIRLTNSVKTFGYAAFLGCTNIQYVYYDGTIADWCEIDFDKNSNPLMYATQTSFDDEQGNWDLYDTRIQIPNGVKEIKPYAFCGFKPLQELILPEGVESIGEYAFEGCAIKTLNIPSSVKTIDEWAFWNCKSLETVTFGTNSLLTSIGENAFYNCSKLTTITIPYNVNFIGTEAFYNSGLTSAIFENTNGWFRTTNASATTGTNYTSDFMADATSVARIFTSSSWRNYYIKRI